MIGQLNSIRVASFLQGADRDLPLVLVENGDAQDTIAHIDTD